MDMLFQRSALLYFSYDKSLDKGSRSILYKNILQFVNPSSEDLSGLCAGDGAVCHGTAVCRADEQLSSSYL